MSSTLSGYRTAGSPASPGTTLQGEPSVASGVSWAAVFAGALAAAALSLILLVLGTGLGLSSISPWSTRGASAVTFGISAVVWITVTQILSSGLGGYLAGRLRTRWTGVHTDEVYFRDTAHGFLAWCVATLVTAVLLTSALAAIVGGAAKVAGSVAEGTGTAVAAAAPAAANAAGNDNGSGPAAYLMDSLFRRDAGATAAPAAPATPVPVGEVTRIFANGIKTGTLPPEDVRYVGQLVAERSGLSQPDAEKRVSDTFAKAQAQLRDAANQAKEAADKARKGTIYASLWLFISLLAGAFSASLAATYGGRERDL